MVVGETGVVRELFACGKYYTKARVAEKKGKVGKKKKRRKKKKGKKGAGARRGERLVMM